MTIDMDGIMTGIWLLAMRLITGLAAGVHTIALRWKVSTANTATLYAGAGTAALDIHPQFWAREVS